MMILVAIFGLIVSICITGNIVLFVFSGLVNRITKLFEKIPFKFKNDSTPTRYRKYEQFLQNKFKYYDKLSTLQQQKFLSRVGSFIRSKEFVGKKEFEVTDEVKVLIAASAIQLTFGLKKYILDYFDRIFVYPEPYYSRQTDKYHMGEANITGILVVSWKNLIKGFAIPDDTYNVGLHEMAHALELEKRLGGDYDFYFATYYEKWKLISEDEYFKVHDGEDSFFRDYAGTNRHEFFAVCVEYFFEDTIEFKKSLPQVYNHLCILLNQDPLNPECLISNANHKSEAELIEEGNNSEEIMSTEVSFFAHLRNIGIGVLAFIIIFGRTQNFIISFIIVGVLTIIVTAIALSEARQAVLYNKLIGFKTLFGKLKAAYYLDDIVSVELHQSDSGYEIVFLILQDGKIETSKLRLLTKEAKINKLLELLEEKGVLVKK